MLFIILDICSLLFNLTVVLKHQLVWKKHIFNCFLEKQISKEKSLESKHKIFFGDVITLVSIYQTDRLRLDKIIK